MLSCLTTMRPMIYIYSQLQMYNQGGDAPPVPAAAAAGGGGGGGGGSDMADIVLFEAMQPETRAEFEKMSTSITDKVRQRSIRLICTELVRNSRSRVPFWCAYSLIW